MRKSHQSSPNDKTAFRKYKRKIFQTSAVRTGVCAYMDATLLHSDQPDKPRIKLILATKIIAAHI